MARPGLPNEVRAFIVQSLACFDSLGTIREAIKKEFGREITPQSIEAYDPTKKAGRNLSPQWRKLFEDSRAAFLADITPIAISHRAVRLRSLQRMATKAEEMRNLPLAASLLEQAAKEVGEAYTNRQKHEHTGKDGKDLPAPPAPVTIFQLPDNGRA